jgi:hypothetical protein
MSTKSPHSRPFRGRRDWPVTPGSIEDPVIDAIRRSALEVLLHVTADLPERGKPKLTLAQPNLHSTKAEGLRNVKDNDYSSGRTL